MIPGWVHVQLNPDLDKAKHKSEFTKQFIVRPTVVFFIKLRNYFLMGVSYHLSGSKIKCKHDLTDLFEFFYMIKWLIN